LDDHLLAWLDDDREPEWDLESPANVLLEPEESIAMWQMCQATDWAHLPNAGGWLDQDDIFLHDALLIAKRLSMLRKRKKSDRDAHAKAAQALGIKGKALQKLLGKG